LVFAQAAQLNVRLAETPVAPLDGEGFEGVPGVAQPITTFREFVQEEMTVGWSEHLAWAFTA
jgi:hypothetical protein